MIAVCRIPKDITLEHYEYMLREAENVPDSRIDELLEAIPDHKNEWLEELDVPAFEDVKMRHADALGDFEANGGRGVIAAEHIDRLQWEMDMMEFDAKRLWLACYLRNRLHRLVEPIAQRTLQSKYDRFIIRDCEVVDSAPDSKWKFLMATEDSEAYEDVLLLDASHVCRIDLSERMADEIATEIGDGNEDDNFYEDVTSAGLEYTSNVSNGGLRECIYYLLELGWDEASIRASLRGE